MYAPSLDSFSSSTPSDSLSPELLERRSSAFEHLADGVMVTTTDGVIIDWNAGATRMFGWSRAEMLGKTPAVLHRPCDAARLTATINEAAVRDGRWSGEIAFIRKDGSTGICETSTVPMRDEQGVIFATLGINHDITARKAAEGQLIEQNHLLQTLIDALEDLIFFKDTEGRFLLVNAAYHRFWGLPKDSAIGKTVFELDGPRANAAVYHANDMAVVSTGEAVINREEPFHRCDGISGWFLTSKFPMRDAVGTLVGVVGMARDISARRAAERALADEREKLRTILDALPDPVFVKDLQGRHVLNNQANLRLFNLTAETANRTVFEMPIPQEHAVQYAEDDHRVMETGVPIINREEPFTTPDNRSGCLLTSKFPLRDSAGGIVGLVGIGRDITEMRRAEAERKAFESKLQQSQKLESLGILAGGVAHDFNNLLTGVLGNASLAKTILPAESVAIKMLDQIESVALRASDLCKQMLAYSGKGRFIVQPLDLNAIILETAALLKVTIDKRTAVHFLPDDHLPPIVGDATQLRQVIMNLVINAAESISDHAGTIYLATRTLHVDSGYLSRTYHAPDLPGGEYVCLEVTDNGAGMSEEIAARIFEPFFTTKFTGRGLGLAAVFGIIRGHSGAIRVTSVEGRGSTFHVLFPCAEGRVQLSPPAPEAAPDWTGSGQVLIIDDEETVRDAAGAMLEALGFETTMTCDGLQGLDVFTAAPDSFAFVLLDLTMPNLNGVEVFARIRRLRPETRVLLVSGFNEQEATAGFLGEGPAGFLQKPFRLAQLRDKVREILL